MKISRARLLPGFGPELADITIADGVITHVAAHDGRVGDVDADGALALPGLWDAHVHFSTHALIKSCLDLHHATDFDELLGIVQGAVSARLLLGFGFRAGTWDAPPTAADLDAVTHGPVALIAGDMHAVWCNTEGLAHAGAAGHPTGYLVEDEAFHAISELMRTQETFVDEAVRQTIPQATARGLVGVVDFQMDWALGGWQRRAAAAPLDLRVHAGSYPEDLDRLLELGWHTGQQVAPNLVVGPLKIIADGTMSTKTANCIEPYDNPLPHLPHGKANWSEAQLHEVLNRARAGGLHVAVHAIGDMACRRALDSFQATGASGSIEHAQLINGDDLARFAALGISASVQPSHLIDDEPLIPEIWPHVGRRLFPLRSLLDAGASLALGSDAPVAPLDPWLSMDAAVNRTYEPAEAISPTEALRATTRSSIAVGQPADVILVDASPEALLRGQFRDVEVLRTFLGGRTTHTADGAYSNGEGSPAP